MKKEYDFLKGKKNPHMGSHFHILALPIFKDNYIWVILNPEKTKAIAVDPGEASTLIAFLEKEKIHLEAVLITHHHFDHSGGVLELKKHYPTIAVFGPMNEDIAGVDEKVSEKETITTSFLPTPIQVLDIPGHTTGHIAYYFSGNLFCGDTLFSVGCGRLFGGTAETLFASLTKMAALPDETNIYCGHEYTLNNLRFAMVVEPDNRAISAKIATVTDLRMKGLPTLPSTLKEEKEINPFLRCHHQKIMGAVGEQSGVIVSSPVETFKLLREWKDDFIA